MRFSHSSRSRASKLRFLSEVHATLHRVAQEFTAMEALPGIVRPPEPLDLEQVFPDCEAYDDEYPDRRGLPWRLTEELVLSISWESGLGCSYELYAVDIPGGVRTYVEFYELLGDRILAASPPALRIADGRFVEALLSSNCRNFGTEIFGGAPDSIGVGIDLPRERWIELFCNLFYASDLWSDLEKWSEPENSYAELERTVEAGRGGQK